MQKSHFLLLKKLKYTESAQLCDPSPPAVQESLQLQGAVCGPEKYKLHTGPTYLVTLNSERPNRPKCTCCRPRAFKQAIDPPTGQMEKSLSGPFGPLAGPAKKKLDALQLWAKNHFLKT